MKSKDQGLIYTSGDFMDFYVGKSDRIREKKVNSKNFNKGMIEGEIVMLRGSRSVIRGELHKRERRSRTANVDPGLAKILVLMIEEGVNLPDDLSSKNYKAFVRFKRVP